MIHNAGGNYQGQKCTYKGTNETIDNQPNPVSAFPIKQDGAFVFKQEMYAGKSCCMLLDWDVRKASSTQ